MVCCANTLPVNNNAPDNNLQETAKDEPTAIMDDLTYEDKLKLTRIAGGSIIDYPPLFSPDGEVLFVLSQNAVLAYSTSTGELLRVFDGPVDGILSCELALEDNTLLVACTKNGSIYKWKWQTGVLDTKIQLPLPTKSTLFTCNLLEVTSNLNCAFITYKQPMDAFVQWAMFDIVKNKRLNCPLKLKLSALPVRVAVETNHFHYIAIVQGYFLYAINCKTWFFTWWKSAHLKPFTCVRAHPTEELIATGDETGKVFFWRHFHNVSKPPITVLYHWHHTPVTSIAFTTVGSGFYTSGQEAVLVKWNIERPDLKDFLPRMSSEIMHISVSDHNRKTAVCTADNGVHILSAQNKPLCVLQNFTFVHDVGTGLDKFPVGLQLNPRTNCLVLNGRIGYLQFFSTNTKSLLYNMDIVVQNRLSPETDKVLYDIRVTHAAFNTHWMATGEVWDDQEHVPELRLKFWEYVDKNQNYFLNTNVELPHEDGFHSIVFSSQFESNNLQCATAGKDNIIKMWALVDSDNIHKTGKVWTCIGKMNYRNLPVVSINFSQDGSLLAAGFANNLCIIKPDILKIKAVLTAPNCFDGTLQKVKISLPKDIMQNTTNSRNHKRNGINEKHEKVIQLYRQMVENNDTSLLSLLRNPEKNLTKKSKSGFASRSLTPHQEELVFKRIKAAAEMNLFQKISVLQKLEIFSGVPKETQQKLLQYVHSKMFKIKYTEQDLVKSIRNMCRRRKFKAKYKLHTYFCRKRFYSSQVQDNLITLMELLNLKEKKDNGNINKPRKSIDYSTCNGRPNSTDRSQTQSQYPVSSDILPPLQKVAAIKSVHFASGEFAHLIVVCTEHRVLVWNLLTLKLQCILKLSVHKMVVDPLTNLFAAFTMNRELYVFLPNAPMPIYRRANIPPVYGACWVPRRQPRAQSINIDWQSMSTLYFLTHNQELMYLASESDFNMSSVGSFVIQPQENLKYSTFGTFALKQVSEVMTAKKNSSTLTIGVPGQSAAKKFIQMPTHSMAPLNTTCNSFLISLMKVEKDEKRNPREERNSIIEEEEDSDEEIANAQEKRSTLKFLQSKQISSKNHVSDQIEQMEKLKKILEEEINMSF